MKHEDIKVNIILLWCVVLSCLIAFSIAFTTSSSNLIQEEHYEKTTHNNYSSCETGCFIAFDKIKTTTETICIEGFCRNDCFKVCYLGGGK